MVLRRRAVVSAPQWLLPGPAPPHNMDRNWQPHRGAQHHNSNRRCLLLLHRRAPYRNLNRSWLLHQGAQCRSWGKVALHLLALGNQDHLLALGNRGHLLVLGNSDHPLASGNSGHLPASDNSDRPLALRNLGRLLASVYALAFWPSRDTPFPCCYYSVGCASRVAHYYPSKQ